MQAKEISIFAQHLEGPPHNDNTPSKTFFDLFKRKLAENDVSKELEAVFPVFFGLSLGGAIISTLVFITSKIADPSISIGNSIIPAGQMMLTGAAIGSGLQLAYTGWKTALSAIEAHEEISPPKSVKSLGVANVIALKRDI